jgi:two-component system nitrate/nitrite response regulator NarL
MPGPERIRVLVVDDHTLFRRGLIALLSLEPGLQIVGDAADAGEALRRVSELHPDVVLLDNHLPGATGIDAIAGLREASPGSRVLMLTVSEDARDLAGALKAGAHGYVLKTIDGPALVQAIRRVVAGESVVSPEMTGKLVSAFQSLNGSTSPSALAAAPTEPLAQLSPREREILEHIARGASNKEIGRALDIAETTVKIHVQHILRKLNLSSRVQAAVYLTSRA